MWMRTMRLSSVLQTAVLPTAMLLAALTFAPNRAWAMGEILGQTKDELKLKYDVTVQEHSFAGAPTERVTVVLSLADEGSIKPLDDVQLVIPGQVQEKDGGHFMDLVVAISLQKEADGKQVARVHLRKEWAERAQFWLNTHTMDGKALAMEQMTHIIPVASYMKNAPVAPAVTKPDRSAAAPAATEQKKP